MTMPTSSQIIPTLENFFGLYIGNEYESADGNYGNPKWTNPYLQQKDAHTMPTLSAITPYIPGDNQQFSATSPSEFWNHDVTVIILSKLDLENLNKSSSVCKRFYLASKADFIWGIQLCNLLPNVTVIHRNLCSFTPEQQYKVIFKRILNECKAYIAKLNRNQELFQNRQNELKTLELEFAEVGGEDAATRFNQNLDNVLEQDSNVELPKFIEKSSDRLASQLQQRIMDLRDGLLHFYGANYETDKTIALDSREGTMQGAILQAIHVLVPNAFNNQDRFDLVITKSEVTKNTSSSNSGGPVVEDVTDVAAPG